MYINCNVTVNSPKDIHVPHPPPQTKEEESTHPPRKTSPRRNIKHDVGHHHDNKAEVIPHQEAKSSEKDGKQRKSGPEVVQQRKSGPEVVQQRKPGPEVVQQRKSEQHDDEVPASENSAASLQSSQRHVEAIRQYHEQR